MSDFYIPPLPDDFTDKVMERIESSQRETRLRLLTERIRNKMQHSKAKKHWR